MSARLSGPVCRLRAAQGSPVNLIARAGSEKVSAQSRKEFAVHSKRAAETQTLSSVQSQTAGSQDGEQW